MPKLLELLIFMVEQPNIIITRDEFLEHLWQSAIVTDIAINKLIGNLRKALGGDVKKPRYIQTVSKRGYQFVCQTTLLDGTAP